MSWISRTVMEAWTKSLLGKPCPLHPDKVVQEGRYGAYCPTKIVNGWCEGGKPTDEWLADYYRNY